MSKPFKVSAAYEYVSSFTGTVLAASATQIVFTPLNFAKPDGPPPGAPNDAVPAMPAHEILITNPTANVLKLAVADVNQAGSANGMKVYPSMEGQQVASMKPLFIHPADLPAISAGNEIIVPANCIAFPIKVRAYGLTIQAVSADAAGVSIQAYWPINLLA